MASIDCRKYTTQQVGGLSVHFDYNLRLKCEHANPHIDKTRTHLNSFYDCSGYSEMRRRRKDRVAEMDELHPPERVRKDRITAVMMEIPVPKAISDKGLTDQFLQDTYAMIGELAGKENMCGMTIHRDEIHDYIDHGGKIRTSLEHGHVMVVPYARWTAKETVYGADGKPLRRNGKIMKKDVEREGINGKHFLTRSFLQELQDEMQDMVLAKYGISYQTSQEPMHMTVEELKRESARAAAIIGRAEQHAHQVTEELSETKQDIAALRTEKEALDDVIRHQKALIRSSEEYEQLAGELDTVMDGVQAQLLTLPTFAKLFREKEAKSFVASFLESLKKVMVVVQAWMERMLDWERKAQPDVRLSEPLQAKKASLDEQIGVATAKAAGMAAEKSTNRGDGMGDFGGR